MNFILLCLLFVCLLYTIRHMFSYNGDIIHSYDVCANCEAHAVLLQISNLLNLPSVNKLSQNDLELITNKINFFSSIMNMSNTDRANNINFINCPTVSRKFKNMKNKLK